MVKIGDKILQSSIQESSAIFFFFFLSVDRAKQVPLADCLSGTTTILRSLKKNINLQVIPKDKQEFRDLLKGWLVDYNYLFI